MFSYSGKLTRAAGIAVTEWCSPDLASAQRMARACKFRRTKLRQGPLLDNKAIENGGNMKKFSLVAAIALLSACGGAPDKSELEGAWQFKTELYGSNVSALGSPIRSVMTGTMLIESDGDGGYLCRLETAERTVDSWSESNGTTGTGTASQTCRVAMDGDAVTILSEVVSATTENYSPDNFNLTYNGDWMEGKLSSSSSPRVVFVRSGAKGVSLPFTLFKSEVSAARQDLGDATYLGYVDGSNCVYGLSNNGQKSGAWRTASLVTVCDGERNGTAVRKLSSLYNIGCENREAYLAQETYYDPDGIFIDMKSFVDDNHLDPGPNGSKALSFQDNSPIGDMVRAACARSD